MKIISIARAIYQAADETERLYDTVIGKSGIYPFSAVKVGENMMSDAEVISLVQQLALTRCRRSADESCVVTELSEVGEQIDPKSSEPCEHAWYVTVSFPNEPESSTDVRVRQVAICQRNGQLTVIREWEY